MRRSILAALTMALVASAARPMSAEPRLARAPAEPRLPSPVPAASGPTPQASAEPRLAPPAASAAPRPPALPGVDPREPLHAGAASGPRPQAPAEPLGLSADQLDLDVQAKTAVLAGHVVLTRGALTVRCPRVELRYDDGPRVRWARGAGGVVAELEGVRAEAPEVEIDLAARSLVLRGGVRITRGDGWLTAERATIDMATGRLSLAEVKGSLALPEPAP